MLFALRLIFWLMPLSFILSPLTSHTNEAQPSTIQVPAFTDPVKISLINEDSSIQPGHPFWIAIELKIDNHWHAYWKNPGDAGMPPIITWNLPEGFEAGTLIWPTPKRFDLASTIGIGYEDQLILLAQITPPASYPAPNATIQAEARWVVCSDTTCLPGDGQLSLELPVKSEEPAKASEHIDLFTEARNRIPKKQESITAKRNNDLVEIAFNNTFDEKIHEAEFFPEQKKSINLTVPSLVQESDHPSSPYTVVLKELSVQDSLKGVLVLHTNQGTKAYEIDTPIISPKNDRSDVSMSATIGSKTSMNLHDDPDREASKRIQHSFEFEGGVALAIFLAFIGGMILNLMPCVLPVISFKVLGFIKLAGQSRKLIFQHGIAFSVGVLLSFWVLAALLLILQAYGRSVGWGFQLQEPLFVAVLAAFLFIFGLSLFGIFEFGTSIMSAAGDAQQKTSSHNQLLSSFFSGILATAVATPCTGPFLGSAVGFAVTLPAYQAMMIFTSLGLGMAFPYLALAAFPTLLRYMPKPGPWMVTFKELMGFLMMASVIWLVWVFSAQTSTFAVSILLVGFFLFAFSCWIYGRWATPMCKRFTRILGTLSALVFFALGSYALIVSTSSWAEAMGGMATNSKVTNEHIADVWEEFSPERVAELRQQGIPVFIDFTAKWCLICQANHLVLSGDEVSEKFSELGVVRMKADWTKNDDIIAAELRKFGRNSVPLYILYDSDPESDPAILPQVLTPDAILESLQQL